MFWGIKGVLRRTPTDSDGLRRIPTDSDETYIGANHCAKSGAQTVAKNQSKKLVEHSRDLHCQHIPSHPKL